ncbi:MAG: ABC transporter ATP-binding protein [Bacteroidales bacterium]|nr:ABC transporter ATP-binding protein [Bacteroidales bacterium]
MSDLQQPLLSLQGLSVDFLRNGEYCNVVRDVSFNVFRGRTLGIVGESGSGKSVSCMSLMHLLPTPQARVSAGKALYYASDLPEPVDLLALSETEIRKYRGGRISMIFQEPMTSLNPVQRCGQQVVEMLRQHKRISVSEARRQTLRLFEDVQLPYPQKIFRSYPHQISGGQKQRVMIAMALACHPDILIADEPTTALDVIVQRTILDLLKQVQQKYQLGIIFITHDLGVIAQLADDVAVMYKGKIIESGSANQVLQQPQHPYTKGLLACRPPLDGRPLRLPTVSDFLEEEVAHKDGLGGASVWDNCDADPVTDQRPLLSVRNLYVDYAVRRNVFGKPLQVLHAVDGVSFDIYRGETLGLVGGSGCGKTTLGRSLLKLINRSSGSVFFDGRRIDTLSISEMRSLRTRMQIIFQDPYSSLNPHTPIGEAIAEPLRVHQGLNLQQSYDRVVSLMEQVGLTADQYGRYPHEFSGGQRQRVCIARALILEPELVVCDESVSALDVSVQAQVLNLLNDLKRQHGFTYLFITHDLAVVKFLADRIMVMQNGHIVECEQSDKLYADPQHPYTRQLIGAIPRIQ